MNFAGGVHGTGCRLDHDGALVGEVVGDGEQLVVVGDHGDRPAAGVVRTRGR